MSGADITIGIGVILLADGLPGDGGGGGANHPGAVQLRLYLTLTPLAGTGLVTLDRAYPLALTLLAGRLQDVLLRQDRPRPRRLRQHA